MVQLIIVLRKVLHELNDSLIMNKHTALAVLLFLCGVLFTSCEVEENIITINKEQLHHVWNLKKIVSDPDHDSGITFT